MGLRKELVLVTWRGATPSCGAGHLLSCLLLPVCKDPGRFPGTPTSLPRAHRDGSVKPQRRRLVGDLLLVPWRRSLRANRVGTPSATGTLGDLLSSLVTAALGQGRGHGRGDHPDWYSGHRTSDVVGRHGAHRRPLRGSHGVATTPPSSAALSRSFPCVLPARAQGPAEAARDSRTRRGWPEAGLGDLGTAPRLESGSLFKLG